MFKQTTAKIVDKSNKSTNLTITTFSGIEYKDFDFYKERQFNGSLSKYVLGERMEPWPQYRMTKTEYLNIVSSVHELAPEYMVEVERTDASLEWLMKQKKSQRPVAHLAYGIGCMDDRKSNFFDYLNDGVLKKIERVLRPKVAGGEIVLAAVYELITNYKNDRKLLEIIDISNSRIVQKDGRSAIGYHTGDNFDSDTGKIDCAGIDRMVEILHFAANHEHREIFKTYMKKTMGKRYSEQVADNVFKRLELVVGNSKLGDGYTGEKVIEMAQKNPTHSSHVVEEHDAIGVIVSDVEYMVIDQQVLRKATGGKAGFFGINLWIMRKRAHDFYENDDEAEKDFNDNVRYHMAVLYSVAAIFALTDGSLDWFVVSDQN